MVTNPAALRAQGAPFMTMDVDLSRLEFEVERDPLENDENEEEHYSRKNNNDNNNNTNGSG